MRMLITDVFHLSDGRSAFTVVPEGAPKLIGAGLYDLKRNGQTLQTVHVENEMLNRTGRGSAARSVSTSERADVPAGPPTQPLELVSRG